MHDVFRVGGAAPPAASRCSARTSLRTPSRGDPPRRAIRARNAVHSDTGSRPHSWRANLPHDELGGSREAALPKAHQGGVGAGSSAKRGTSAAATGPRGARSAPLTRISTFGLLTRALV